MKESIKKISVFFLLFVYLFAIAQSGNYSFSEKSAGSKQQSSFVNFSDNWLCPAKGNETLVNLTSRATSFINNSIANFFASFIKPAEDLFRTFFTQYSFYERNILERFSPPDIIFPFHYFW